MQLLVVRTLLLAGFLRDAVKAPGLNWVIFSDQSILFGLPVDRSGANVHYTLGSEMVSRVKDIQRAQGWR